MWINGQPYQLSVDHVLQDDPSVDEGSEVSSGFDDCSFDGDSETEEDSDQILDVPSSGSRTPEDLRSWSSDEHGSIQRSSSSRETKTESPTRSAKSSSSNKDIARSGIAMPLEIFQPKPAHNIQTSNHNTITLRSDDAGYRRVGKIALTANQSALDCSSDALTHQRYAVRA